MSLHTQPGPALDEEVKKLLATVKEKVANLIKSFLTTNKKFTDGMIESITKLVCGLQDLLKLILEQSKLTLEILESTGEKARKSLAGSLPKGSRSNGEQERESLTNSIPEPKTCLLVFDRIIGSILDKERKIPNPTRKEIITTVLEQIEILIGYWLDTSTITLAAAKKLLDDVADLCAKVQASIQDAPEEKQSEGNTK